MNRRVVVTGLGYVTSLGFGHEDHEAALREGRSGAAPITRFSTEGFKTRVGGQCDEKSLTDRLLERWPARALRDMAVDTRMLLWAVSTALAAANLERASRPLPALLGTTLEGFLQAETWYAQKRTGRARPRLLLHATSGAQIASVAGLLRVPMEPHVVSNACSTGITTIGRLFNRVRAGSCDVGLAGGYDALVRFVHLGFDSLGALTGGRCAPFERGRTGFFIGDGAAVLVLESLESARRRGARIRGEILGYGQSADSYHNTHPDPEGTGVARAIREGLKSAGVEPGEIDYVNAHGTATPANDSAEAKGILVGLGEKDGRRVPVSSTKPRVGHTLGAAGAVEQCFCMLALERGFLPPQQAEDPDPQCPLNLVRNPQGRPKVAMNNAFGFGGANGVLLSRRWEES